VRALLAIALALATFACDRPKAPATTPGSARATTPAANDPWNAPAPPSDVPDLAQRRAVVDKACPAVTGPYFYAIAKAGKTSYLLGTRHLSVALSEFPPVVTERLRTAHLVVFEIDPHDEAGLPKPPIALKDELGAELWRKLVAIEGDVQRVAEERKIPMRGLETSKFQDELIDHLIDMRMLRAALANTKDRVEFRDETARDLTGYCAGTDSDPGIDPKTRKELLAAGYTAAELAQLDDDMVYARNRDWIPKLEKLFATGDVFVAVGADHLIGDRGVVALLKARGFTSTRITK
jgi:uncharacterized protein YbaP (TraB family)